MDYTKIREKLASYLKHRYTLLDDSGIMFSFCPYRVCPVGAHIDHQKGNVTGFAVNYGITIAFISSHNHFFEATSMNFEGTKGGNLLDISEKKNDWADYLRGAAKILYDKYMIECGIYCVIDGSLPIGGVSSSAAVIIAFMKALCTVNGLHLAKDEVIKLVKKVENEYVGVNSGTLDQSCELYSKRNHLLYLDTSVSKYMLIPTNPNMKPFKIAVIFSGVKRTLVGSAYNTRVDELKSASYALKAFDDYQYGSFKDSVLRDVPRKVFEQYKEMLPKNWLKRATHYYDEMDRVADAIEAWKDGDIEKFGRICSESGRSSIVNYEAGSPELIAIHNIMHETEGIYGGRFSGAGFKGCCLAIINPEFEDSIRENVSKRYLTLFPQYKDSFKIYFCETADGCDF